MTGTREDTAAAQAEMEAHKIIKAMRLYLGMTQEELARKAGISPGLYFRYEKVPDISSEESSQRFVRC